MKKKSAFRFLLAALAVIVLISSQSCNKPKPCKGIITVMDSAGVAVQPYVPVKLYAIVSTSTGTTTADLTAEGVTDSKGQVSFTFNLPVIMNISAEKTNCTSSAPFTSNTGSYVKGVYCKGKGVIKFEEKDEPTEKTIYLTY